ncbi:MAG: hypothetical protein PHQ40_09605 [Anaerolineaceae bacterium]|nr:hypothetical protein [Anaerolineaceae bacterium]
MIEEHLHKERKAFIRALPIYLAVQGTTLLMTFLDFPVYMEAYQLNHYLTLSGWAGAWFVLEMLGLGAGILLLLGKTWRSIFDGNDRIKLLMGYFLGVVAGMLTLGIRLMPIMPAEYFWMVGGLLLILGCTYFIWKKRLHSAEEIFP